MQRRTITLLMAVFMMILFILGGASGVLSAPKAQTTPSLPTATPDPRLSINNEVCLSCHGQPGTKMTLDNGDELDLYVPAQEYNASVHGSMGYACVQCHRTIGNYPHQPFQAQDTRDVSLKLYPACQGCHEHQYELAQDSAHAAAFANGNREAAVCTDCHSAHAVRRLNEPGTLHLLPDARVWVPQTCSKCHSAIYNLYQESVHGAALTDEGNLDVPTCIDCHGVHNIENPTTVTFRLRSPDICAKCHTDEDKMAKYGISTQVLSTYVADFHGTTVALFEKMSPDAETNKPVCYDCHGIHDIRQTDDPQKGLQVRENLLKRCQICHPDATSNFPTAWMSHYIPSPERNPAVYYVNLFYKFFIPTILGGMAILVVLDLNKLIGNRRRKPLPEEGAISEVQVIPDEPTGELGDPDLATPETGQSSLPPEEATAGEEVPETPEQSVQQELPEEAPLNPSSQAEDLDTDTRPEASND
jgi:Zn-finger protein